MIRPLIVTADDYGLTAGTCRAVLSAHLEGIVTATSALVLPAGAIDRLEWLDDAPDLAVGVHLAVVGEDPPLLSAREVPTLVGRHGRLAASWRQLLPRLAARRVDPDDLRREFGAQLEAVAAHRPVTHLDTHQHVHLWPSVAEVVVGLAADHGIARIRVPRPSATGWRGAALARLADRLDGRLGRAGLDRTEGFRGLDEAGGWTSSRLVATVAEAAEPSVEINTHPGASSDADRDRYAWGYGWGAELVALTDPVVREAVARAGFTLVGRLEGDGR